MSFYTILLRFYNFFHVLICHNKSNFKQWKCHYHYILQRHTFLFKLEMFFFLIIIFHILLPHKAFRFQSNIALYNLIKNIFIKTKRHKKSDSKKKLLWNQKAFKFKRSGILI